MLSSNADATNELHKVRLEIINEDNCNDYFSVLMSDGDICAHSYGKDTCDGDSGGPLLINRNNKDYQIGVICFGDKNLVNHLVHFKILVIERLRNS